MSKEKVSGPIYDQFISMAANVKLAYTISIWYGLSYLVMVFLSLNW